MAQSASKRKDSLQIRDNGSKAVVVKQLNDLSKLSGHERREAMNALYEFEAIPESDVASIVAKTHNCQKIDFSQFPPDEKVIRKIPRKICEKHILIPVMEVEGVLIVAFSDPGDEEAKDTISALTKSKVEVVVAERREIRSMIKKHYSGADNVRQMFSLVESQKAQEDLKDEFDLDVDLKEKNPIVQSVNYIIKEGIRLRCSDIHIEIYEKKLRIRLRVDGHLFEHIRPPLGLASGIISRIKVLSKMDISEKRIPQDSKLKVKCENKIVDFRISTVPVLKGEKMVLRLLSSSALKSNMGDLGMDSEQIDLFKKSLGSSQGFIIMTGPTGSGKTTTIYSGLMELNKPHTNISTVEDPVEYSLDGINQVQINTRVGLTFATVLRAFLRQDPDVILVGEIRDKETADVAYRAAATGHLVLSTLHTNDTSSTITRLLDIGVPAYSVAENTSLIIAQRLLRVLCEHCKEPQKVSHSILVDIGVPKEVVSDVMPHIMHAEGCSRCNDSGYNGRVAVYELMPMSSALKTGIFKGWSPNELKGEAIQKLHMKTLRKSALEKLVEGITSVNEVLYGTIGDD